MPITRPNVLQIGASFYDMTKIVAWTSDPDNASNTLVRFDAGSTGAIAVSLPTVDFEDAVNGGGSISTATLLSGVTTVSTGTALPVGGAKRTYQATVVGVGAVTATVLVEISNDGVNWITQSTISLSGTTSDTDGVALEAPWPFVRGRVTAITGTSATVTLTVHTAD